MKPISILAPLICSIVCGPAVFAQELPFAHSVEVYRNDTEGTAAFALRLEQPFLAEEFEKSNYLRLRSSDSNAYLIYPKETKFHQKHAEFYGRLKGEGQVEVQLSYETVSENLDGSRRVQVRSGTIKIDIPTVPADRDSVGPIQIFQDWARQQNDHFARLLTYYPDESFFQYCLLQSEARYGIKPPSIPKQMPTQDNLENGLYRLFTGSLAIQESLQRRTLGSASKRGAYNTHISSISPPSIRSHDYQELLDQRLDKHDGIKVQIHDVSRLIPADQYFLHFNSFKSLGEATDLASQWGDDLLRLQTLTAQDNRLQVKLEEQLGLHRSGMEQLFDQGIATEVAVTGADPYLLDGTDITVIVKVADEDAFAKPLAQWTQDSRDRHADLVEREFNYRGHQVTARYTNDRLVSSFMTKHDGYYVFSNSHRAIRHIVDASLDEIDSLDTAADYRYISTILPPSDADDAGYYYASDAFIRRVIGPEAKISQKRRAECFNNLVMQNNASMFFRLEYGRSPESLSEMIEKRFIAAEKIVCPHGGAYAFDAASDTCTCSLHNRLRYLTPNAELSVLNVSSEEAAEYERYRTRYQSFWKQFFDPVATRITVAPTVKLETCVLPFANSEIYKGIREAVDKNPRPINLAAIAPSAVASMVMVPGRENTAQYLKAIPGVSEIITQDPTLTDLKWLGDRVSLHFCDGEIIFEIDPTQLTPINLPMVGEAPAAWQALVGSLILTANMPVYVTIDIENTQKAERLLEQFSETAFLRGGNLGPLPTKIDGYRLPDYRGHEVYVVSARLHAVTLRLHMALVDDKLVLATKPDILKEVIDASAAEPTADQPIAQLMIRLNRQALGRLNDDVQLHWAEKSRLACHRNIISIHNFHQLYDVPMDQIANLSEAKYGIRYFCPEDGVYSYDSGTSQVVCSVHGNRESSRQNPALNPNSSSARFIESINQVIAFLRYEDDAMIATVEIDRNQKQ
ncbi:MAG: hypothetical protein KDB00_10340 [Planctomycetales bacterium]|nr:hypothetical protein [Planctomycetales bacterium]